LTHASTVIGADPDGNPLSIVAATMVGAVGVVAPSARP